ncbi:MAG: hypothetical protein F4188_05250, partial [Chloroflexi bacterium]|nr:hypothetical protein [Chloroflexota bacterium]
MPEPPRRVSQPQGPGSRLPPGASQPGGSGLGILLVLVIAALLAAVVIVLFFEPGLIDTSFNTDSETAAETEADGAPLLVLASFESRLMRQVPAIPDVLGVASPIYEVKVPEGPVGPFEFTLRLPPP